MFPDPGIISRGLRASVHGVAELEPAQKTGEPLVGEDLTKIIGRAVG